MPDHNYVAMDFHNPTPATNADDLPGDLLDRANTAFHNIMIGGGVPDNWKMQKLDISDVEVEDLPAKVVWSHKAGNEKLRATITRDGDDYVTSIVYAFAPDGTTYTTIKTATYTRGPGGSVLNIDWS
jgi:hypothetical protein